MKISVIGTGYVGLVTGACFAETGNDVVCADVDGAKIAMLSRGQIPFYEPGLEEIVTRNIKEKRLRFSVDPGASMAEAEIAFICVGTPSAPDGSADLRYVFDAARTAAGTGKDLILVVKSTVPVGTCDKVRDLVAPLAKARIRVASNPEFLREGSAVSDCMTPDRVVVGTDDPDVADRLRALYAPYVRTGAPIYVMTVRSSEMTKYAANALLAQRISFINEISMLCDAVGADVGYVRAGIGADRRIGTQYLFPSVGFGGSCFPKDVRALAALAEEHGVVPRLLRATLDVNETQKRRFAEAVATSFPGGAAGKKVAVWGLAFKAKTDDIRESPALAVIDRLLEAGARVSVFDPVAIPNTRAVYGSKLTYAGSMYEAIEGTEALCVLTEWNQFRTPDFARVKELMAVPALFDGRNLYDPAEVRRHGFRYVSVGRPGAGPAGLKTGRTPG
jgi:UDPglucose 6-dehydrogenase